MIELAEAQARLFALRAPVETEEVSLLHAAGRWASADVVARRTQPARDISAMDGYAVRSCDAPGPWLVIGESAAGSAYFGSVGKGQAVRIFTGAIVPDGADCILIQENATQAGNALTLTAETPTAGKHIRRKGGDFVDGAVLVTQGAPLTPQRIALAAMGGHATLPVRRRLRVALISTGDELVAPGLPCEADQIPSSNAPMLATMLADLPVDIDDRSVIRDDLAQLTAEFSSISNADIIVTIGGASVGDHDLVRPALLNAGACLDFWKIAMRPGKPVMAGTLGGTVVLGLPGNPVSAYVTAFLLLRPLIAHLSGSNEPLPPRIEAQLGAALPANGARLDHVRGILHGSMATPTGVNDSSMLGSLSHSNILIIREINAAPAQVGDLVRCYTIV